MDSTSATVDFFLSPSRDTEAAQSLFWRALRQGALPLRVINADLTPTYPAAIAGLQKLGTLRQRCRHRTARDLNNIVEQDHRASKRRVKAKQGFRPFPAARRTVASSEAIHQMRKGQVRWLPARDSFSTTATSSGCSG